LDAQKSFIHRKKGLEKKFSHNDDLVDLEHRVKMHLVEHGMDSISYFPNPQDPTEMVSIMTEHKKFNLETVPKMLQPQLPLYDVYDRNNDTTASKFIMDTLESELMLDLRDLIEDNNPFPIQWMRFI
jgi:hypothetical protein